MSLPQIECGVPFGEQAKVIVSPGLPLSEVAFASHEVGFPGSPDDGAADEGVAVDGVESAPCPLPPPVVELLSLFSFAQPVIANITAMIESTIPSRSVLRVKSKDFCAAVTAVFLS